MWRIKNDNNGLWLKVLTYKYGNTLELNRENFKRGFIWWRDLASFDREGWGVRENWFKDKLEHIGDLGWSWGRPKGYVVRDTYKVLLDGMMFLTSLLVNLFGIKLSLEISQRFCGDWFKTSCRLEIIS